MTLTSTPPRPARPHNRSFPAAPAVVALLLSALALLAAPALAQGTAVMPSRPGNAGTVDSIVSKANGPILDVFDGALQIDVSNAKITGGDDRFASPVPWAGILPGSRILAQVTVPDAIPAVFPPRLPATSVVVFLTRTGSLSGTVQAVSLAQGSFTLLYTTVHTTAATEWSGTKADGSPVKSLADLSAGMFATATVHADSGRVAATHVHAYAPPTTRIVAFRGKVERIEPPLWTIGGHVVQVTAETKIVGDPKVGDTVDVLQKVTVVPPGMGMPTPVPTAISITKVVTVPPNPGDRTVAFDGVVEFIPSNPAGMGGAPMGHWKISGRDVLVTGLTRVEEGITTGSAVHVKGVIAPTNIGAASNTNQQIVAVSITKR